MFWVVGCLTVALLLASLISIFVEISCALAQCGEAFVQLLGGIVEFLGELKYCNCLNCWDYSGAISGLFVDRKGIVTPVSLLEVG